MSYFEKIKLAQLLERMATHIRSTAFNDRPLPDFWRVGQKVRLITSKEWCGDAGQEFYICKVKWAAEPAHSSNNTIWITPSLLTEEGKYWTSPHEIELVEDHE